MKRLMLLSNSTGYKDGYLDHAMPAIREFLGPTKHLLFVPFALADRAAYTAKVTERFAREGIDVKPLVEGAAGASALEEAPATFVGGGNTFRLLDALQRARFLEPLRRRAKSGMLYLGASAGTVITAPTIKTTNDMPIVQPQWFEALGLVPFQINAHYVDADPSSTHMGETREDRLIQYLEENETPVLGLREGAWLDVTDETVRLAGTNGAKLFRREHVPEDLATGASIDTILGR